MIRHMRLKKIITYIVLISLLVPFLTGFVLIEPVWAFGSEDYKSVLKALFMVFLLSFLGDDSDDSKESNSNNDSSLSEEYVRYQPTEEELETLARAVYSEARGESYVGQVAVAAVILNRVDSPEFPNTINGVVYQRHDGQYAFSAVWDGQIYLTPDETAYQTAKDALNGWDPSDGALYYYNPDTATASWIFENTVPIKRIGKHLFANLKI
ncbi:cell wall hydrolase [Acetohalobium arabaticum]|uniref:Cell wall hydrolase SleB n=1 Tax=Acetohalobium arabaticum (strain ATCC 49924 / DSM 5501 / Z-7288) TaxID=574087 RepID=D9QQ49_ACEAZ|nr:cell wall hydrolase [Acetohalobium arabaticum]ADL12640.1 cell wall hydrolase SleB [Acetohalobium arabaticum DSM 5501]